VVAAKRKIYEARDNGKNEYFSDVSVVKQDVIFILNMLDGIGIGVQQKVYLEHIVRDHLEIIVTDTVERFVEGKWGVFLDARQKDHFAGLMYLYKLFKPIPKPKHTAVS
jgi:hypothetical protein